MSAYAREGVQINPVLSGRWNERIEPLAATLTPRFAQNQVVVTVAIGREYFKPDGVTLDVEALIGDGWTPQEAITQAVEAVMRALKDSGEPGVSRG